MDTTEKPALADIPKELRQWNFETDAELRKMTDSVVPALIIGCMVASAIIVYGLLSSDMIGGLLRNHLAEIGKRDDDPGIFLFGMAMLTVTMVGVIYRAMPEYTRLPLKADSFATPKVLRHMSEEEARYLPQKNGPFTYGDVYRAKRSWKETWKTWEHEKKSAEIKKAQLQALQQKTKHTI